MTYCTVCFRKNGKPETDTQESLYYTYEKKKGTDIFATAERIVRHPRFIGEVAPSNGLHTKRDKDSESPL